MGQSWRGERELGEEGERVGRSQTEEGFCSVNCILRVTGSPGRLPFSPVPVLSHVFPAPSTAGVHQFCDLSSTFSNACCPKLTS